MLPDSALQAMHPVIMTPSHDGKYFHNYTISLLNLVSAAPQLGLNLQISLTRGESLITRARNNCVAAFLANKAWTHLFFIDSDIGFSPMAVKRLLLADRDIVGGVYPIKRENWPEDGLSATMTQAQFEAVYTSYTVNVNQVDEQDEVRLSVDADGFMEVDEAPTGFMMIKRQVFERMMTAYPDLQYRSDSDYSEDLGFHYRFFDCSVDPQSRRYLSEDYHFCHLWKKLGGKLFVDTQSNLSHQGTKLYQGAFAESLISNLPMAVSAPEGKRIKLDYAEPLKINPPPPA